MTQSTYILLKTLYGPDSARSPPAWDPCCWRGIPRTRILPQAHTRGTRSHPQGLCPFRKLFFLVEGSRLELQLWAGEQDVAQLYPLSTLPQAPAPTLSLQDWHHLRGPQSRPGQVAWAAVPPGQELEGPACPPWGLGSCSALVG